MCSVLHGCCGLQAVGLANGASCTNANQAPANERCVFEEALLTHEVLQLVQAPNLADKPLFLFWAMHLVHMPLQIPDAWLAKFAHISNTCVAKSACLGLFVCLLLSFCRDF
jgi:hypothetical protein